MNEDRANDVRLPWFVWLLAWLCTGTMGGFFAVAYFVLEGARIDGLGGAFVMGFYFAAFVGTFLFPAFGIVGWLRRSRGRNAGRLMMVAGGMTGFLSGLVLGPLCVVTCVMGVSGAYLPVRWWLARRAENTEQYSSGSLGTVALFNEASQSQPAK